MLVLSAERVRPGDCAGGSDANFAIRVVSFTLWRDRSRMALAVLANH